MKEREVDTTNLKLRGYTYYARLAVPPAQQAIVGKTEILRSLKTGDVREASRIKHEVLAAMQREISRIVAGAQPQQAGGDVLAAAAMLRETHTHEDDDAALAFDATVERHLERAAKTHGVDRQGRPLLPDDHLRSIRLAHDVFHRGNVTLLSVAIADYLKETAPRVRVGTINEKRRQLREFAKWLKSDCSVTDITKKMAGRYIAEVLLTKGHAPKTVKDTLSNLSAFFVWLEGRGEVDVNPWRGMSRTVKGSTRGAVAKRRPWQDSELLKLLTDLPEQSILIPLTILGAYTGMRIDEIASMKLTEVGKDSFSVTAGKTQASVRRIPQHPLIKPMVARLVATARDAYLVPGLLSGGADAKRGHLVSKQFGSTIRSLGFTDTALTFHTLRNSFMTRCEAAGVPESTTKLLVGHSRQSLTYGLYSPGVEFKKLADAVAAITYGKVDAFVRAIGGKLVIKYSSRHRRRRIS
jgi:integrase